LVKGVDDGMAYHLVLREKKHLFQIIFKRWHIFMDIVRAISSKWTTTITLKGLTASSSLQPKEALCQNQLYLTTDFGSLAKKVKIITYLFPVLHIPSRECSVSFADV